jgi:hypothetical protein
LYWSSTDRRSSLFPRDATGHESAGHRESTDAQHEQRCSADTTGLG